MKYFLLFIFFIFIFSSCSDNPTDTNGCKDDSVCKHKGFVCSNEKIYSCVYENGCLVKTLVENCADNNKTCVEGGTECIVKETECQDQCSEYGSFCADSQTVKFCAYDDATSCLKILEEEKKCSPQEVCKDGRCTLKEVACETTEDCGGDAKCIENSQGVKVCTCKEGFEYNTENKNCVEINECDPNPCLHGTCNDGINSYTCECDEGYEGDNCEINTDDCNPNPCAHGTCVDGVNSYTCDCEAGYEGNNCEINIDECKSDPCVNGTCVDGINSYTCECDEGYEGDNCEINTDDCNPNPCAHGTCVDGVNSYTCECDDGYQDNDNNNTCLPDCNTANLNCEHGSCNDSSGEAVCNCNSGYAGTLCDSCASGYQDNDGDGTCLPDCTTANLNCGHGSCNDSSGEAVCSCETGYTGDACDSCASGYQDNDSNGTCLPDCNTANLSCVNGSCNDTSGEAVCNCNSGYAGTLCDSCASGYQDNDGDGTCLPDCTTANLNCGHGSCNDSSGEAVCSCNQGYTGDMCDSCADGYQDNDSNGTCLPDCNTANLACDHGSCNDSSGEAICECEEGYTGTLCDECADEYYNDNGTCKPCDCVTDNTYSRSNTCNADTGQCNCLPMYEGRTCDTLRHLKIYYTDKKSKGNLGGLEGADLKCNNVNDVNYPDDGHYYKALIAVKNNREKGVTGWIMLRDTKYYSVNDDEIFTTDSEAWIDFDIVKNLEKDTHVWTGFDTDGKVYIGGFSGYVYNCVNWKSSDRGESGIYGKPNYNDSDFISRNMDACDERNRLYCVEQPCQKGYHYVVLSDTGNQSDITHGVCLQDQ